MEKVNFDAVKLFLLILNENENRYRYFWPTIQKIKRKKAVMEMTFPLGHIFINILIEISKMKLLNSMKLPQVVVMMLIVRL